ncbi:PQQ-dependent sugar dehydrogenase [Paenibacillus provencensis]|uniref:PQQ-dependent sugar dehydrogenase n=1 Tax=Paenibacillus provencensis TaxID=441151 RepID=A0ABW3Q866_9BACL|nr:PQQ-dependent sugar dehydrogenase [Paenibacillus sp. MER 78]MCM3127590.1 PQQ-dependent sugar dehydrogenase [Paenibacillus sp. MER 78]
MNKKYLMMPGISLLSLVIAACSNQTAQEPGPSNPAPTAPDTQVEQPASEEEQEDGSSFPYEITTLAAGLHVPWELDFLPDGRMLFTERPGTLRMIENGQVLSEPVLAFDAPFADEGEGGLLGLAVDPDYESNQYVYVYHSYREGQDILNRVLRLKLTDQEAAIDKVLLDDIPGGVNHNGGRLKIGPDGMLYITTGERYEPDMAQDETILGGKILRIHLDGSIPDDNPMKDSEVYSLGHRNAQGLAWHPETGQLYSSEHGQSNYDELNLIEKGSNYGWPLIEGDERAEGMTSPLVHSGTDTWAPSGMTFITQGPWQNSLIVGGLRGEALLRFELDEEGRASEEPLLEVLFENEWGRIRSVSEGPDGTIYLLTNNRDGRGDPEEEDDRIIALEPTE